MLNKFQIQGRFTADPELKVTTSGVSVCKFTLACTKNHKNNSAQNDADFFTFTAWRNNAEMVAKHCQKGDMAVVVGNIQTSTYEKDGKRQYRIEFVVEEIYFLSKATARACETAQNTEERYEDVPDVDSDLPF